VPPSVSVRGVFRCLSTMTFGPVVNRLKPRPRRQTRRRHRDPDDQIRRDKLETGGEGRVSACTGGVDPNVWDSPQDSDGAGRHLPPPALPGSRVISFSGRRQGLSSPGDNWLGTTGMPYEFNAKKYEKASTHQREWGAKLIAELGLTGSEHVLDIGCGDGTLTSQLAKLLPDGAVLGIDASQGMIETALGKEKNNLRFRWLNVDDLDFENQFDLVFSNAALHWVKDHRRLLHNVHRALRPTGRVRFNFAGDGNCLNFFAVVRVAMDQEPFSPFFAGFEWPWYMPAVDEYRHLAEASELRDVRVWGENADRYFPNAEAMVGWIDQPSLVPFMVYLEGPTKGSFRSSVITRMIERTRQRDGRCFETFRRINVSAIK
jgi:trans-aconitate 2-methyltransferase